jgi:hypothetical protein
MRERLEIDVEIFDKEWVKASSPVLKVFVPKNYVDFKDQLRPVKTLTYDEKWET